MKLVWIVAGALALATGTAQALERQEQGAGVSVSVDLGAAGAHRFDVDLATPGCTLGSKLARDARLPVIGTDHAPLALVRGATLNGISLGDLQCATGPRNVLGAEALRGLVVRVDFRAGRLSAHGGAQEGQELAGPDARLVTFSLRPDTPLALPVRLNGAWGVAVIDPESPVSHVNRAMRARAGERREGAMDVLDLAGLRFQLAPQEQESQDGATPALRLGRDVLDGLALVIDEPRRRVWIDPLP